MPQPPPLNSSFAPGENYLLEGALLNEYARRMNAFAGTGNLAEFTGAVNAQTQEPGVPIGLIEVTAKTQGDHLMGVFRWWNNETLAWKTDDELRAIDPSAFHDGRGAMYGPITSVIPGDVVPGYLDRQRAMLVPLPGLYDQSPNVEVSSYRTTSDLRVLSHNGPMGFNAILEYYDPLTKTWLWPSESRIICPEGKGRFGDATGCGFISVPLRHGGRVRMRCWYRPHDSDETEESSDNTSSSEPSDIEDRPELIKGGLRIQAAGRIHKRLASWRLTNTDGEYYYPVAKTTVLDKLALDSDVQSRPRDTPFFKITSDGKAVEMVCQSNIEVWNCLIWYRAYFGKKSEQHHKIRFRNTHSQTVPAYGVMRVVTDRTLADNDPPRGSLDTTKPDTTFATLYLVNGKDPVPSGSYGWGTFLTDCDNVLYGGGFTPVYGQEWGPTSGEWFIVANRLGFLIQGAPLKTGVVRAVQSDVHIVYGKTNQAISKNGTGTVSVWCGPIAAETDTGWDILVTQRFTTSVGSGKWVICWRTHGVWKVAGEC